MIGRWWLLFFVVLGCSVVWRPAVGADLAVVTGEVRDGDGHPQPGAVVAAWDSDDVRRPPAFESSVTGDDGGYRLQLPAGTWYLVAVWRRDHRAFGPMGLDDRHSGPPVRLAVKAGREHRRDFVVMDLRQAARQHAKRNEDLVAVRGVVVDPGGNPVAGVAVGADPRPRLRRFPRYVSPWTGADGAFVLYLEPGTYHLGVLATWPPAPGSRLGPAREIRRDTEGLRLAVPPAAGDDQ